MVKLIVRPLDLAAEGSYYERETYFNAIGRLRAADPIADFEEWRAAQKEAGQIVREHIYTDDGSDVEPLLRRISAKEFDAMFWAILGGDSLGEASDVPSETSTEGTEALSPDGG